jgi:hypothetical protein
LHLWQGKKRKSKAVAAQNKESSPEEGGFTEAPFAVPSRSDKQKRPVKKSRKAIEAEEAQVGHHPLLVIAPCRAITIAASAVIRLKRCSMIFWDQRTASCMKATQYFANLAGYESSSCSMLYY